MQDPANFMVNHRFEQGKQTGKTAHLNDLVGEIDHISDGLQRWVMNRAEEWHYKKPNIRLTFPLKDLEKGNATVPVDGGLWCKIRMKV